MTRREFTGALLAAPKAAWNIGGVLLGGQSYSFRALAFDDMLEAWRKLGVTCLELCKRDIEPERKTGENPKAYRERLREWRLGVPMDVFRQVRRKMEGMGLEAYAYMYDFQEDFTEPEIARGFEMGRALGVKVLTTTSPIAMASRVDPHAARAKIRVGLHNHSWLTRPKEVTTPENYAQALAGCSRYMGINLDVGHLFASGYDPVAFLEKNHERMTTIHLKDRKGNDGPDMPFGKGETPLAALLRLMKEKRYRFPAMVEYEIQGTDTFEEVRRSLEFCKRALA